MLALFRRSQKIWLWGLIIVVVVTFIPWGARVGRTIKAGPMEVMGYYDQQKITKPDLLRAVAAARIELLIQGRTPEELNDTRQLEREAWMRIMMVTEAKNAGIAASPQEIEQYVRNTFFKGQPINQDAYVGMIQQLGGLGMSPREFEDNLRDSILILKLRQSFGQTILVPDEEVRQMYEAQRTLIKVAYVPFSYSNYFPTAPIGTNELAMYYAANEKELTVPPQVDLVAAVVRPDIAGVEVDPTRAEEFYDQHKKMFAVTNKVAATKDTNDSQDAEVKITYKPFSAVSNMIIAILVSNEANNIAFDQATRLCEAMTSVDAEKAKDRTQLFLDSAKKLGIPTFKSGLVSQREDVQGITNSMGLVSMAFSMKAGEVSPEPRIVPDAGQAVVFLKEKNDAYLPALSNIEEKVRGDVRLEHALQATYMAASNLNSKICAQATSFTNAAARLKHHAKVTLPFDRATGTDTLGCPPQVVSRLFAYPANTSVVAPCKEGYMIVCPIEVIEPDFGLLKNHEHDIKEQLMYQHHVLLFQMWMNQLQNKKLKLDQSHSLAQRDQMEPSGDKSQPNDY